LGAPHKKGRGKDGRGTLVRGNKDKKDVFEFTVRRIGGNDRRKKEFEQRDWKVRPTLKITKREKRTYGYF